MFQMDTSRTLFFATALNLLATSAEISVQELQAVANYLSPQIEAFALPTAKEYSLDYDMLDTYALQFVPDDAPTGFLPIRTTANGNCFFNAISLGLCGNESLSEELRVCTSLVILQLRDHILNDDNKMVSDLLKEQILLYSPFAQTDYELTKTNATKQQLALVFENELQHTLKNYSWSGMWQLQALSTALNISIWSIYPKYNSRVRQHFQRLITPLLPYENTLDVIPILWSGYMDANQFHPNHFVPLMNSTRFIHIPSVGTEHSNVDVPKYLPEKHCHISVTLSHIKNNIQLELPEQSVSQVVHPCNTFSCKEILPKYYCNCCNQLILTMLPKSIPDSGKISKYLCSTCSLYFSRADECPLSVCKIRPWSDSRLIATFEYN